MFFSTLLTIVSISLAGLFSWSTDFSLEPTPVLDPISDTPNHNKQLIAPELRQQANLISHTPLPAQPETANKLPTAAYQTCEKRTLGSNCTFQDQADKYVSGVCTATTDGPACIAEAE